MAKKIINQEEIDIKETKKIIDEYVEEQKELLTKDLKKMVDDQVDFAVSKKMKEEEKRYIRIQRKKIFSRDFLIIVLMVTTIYFGFCLYKVDYFNLRTVVNNPLNNDQEKERDNQDQDDEKNNQIYIEKYSYLIDNINIDDKEIFNLYKDGTTNENISNDLKLKIAYKNLEESQLEQKDDMITFKDKDLFQSAKKIFGNKVTINNELFSYNKTKFMHYNDTYLGLKEENEPKNHVYKIISASKEDESLVFVVILAKLSPESELLNAKDEVILKEYQDEDLEEYQEKLNTYKLTFAYQKDNYIFKSIENFK